MTAYAQTVKGITWGVIASCFLSATFLINSLIADSGGHWAWTANLRTLFLIPVLGLVLLFTRQLRPLIHAINSQPWLFVKWGLTGFGVLYTFIAIASLFSPGWMVAAAFQINILAGILLAPFIYNDHRKTVPRQAVILSILILIGVLIMQFEKATALGSAGSVLISFSLTLVGAIVWPLANRKLMVDLEDKGMKLNATQRVLGMSIGCIPLLIILAIVGFQQSGFPPVSQVQASFYSAIFAGFLGGVGFYHATQLVHKTPAAIAAVEATQALEIVFTLLGEMILLGSPFPGVYGQAGIAIVLSGLGLHFRNVLQHSRKATLAKVTT